MCGRLQDKSLIKGISVDDLLKYEEILRCGLCYETVPRVNFSYEGCPRLDGLVLDRAGLVRGGRGWDGFICLECEESLRSGRTPQYALANGLWTGTGMVPELSGLTWLEQKVIARVHVSVQLMKCRMAQVKADHFHPQRKMKGNIITFPMDPTAVVNKLPLAPSVMRDVVKIVLITKKSIDPQVFRRHQFFFVRRDVVKRAITWLIANNPLYSDVQLDNENLSQYPDDGIPEEIVEALATTDCWDEDVSSHSRYDESDDEEG